MVMKNNGHERKSTGKRYKRIKCSGCGKKLDVQYNEPLRDNLTSEANKCLYELQQLNSNLLLSNLDFKTRKLIIENTCKERYMDIRVKIISEFNEEIKNFKNN